MSCKLSLECGILTYISMICHMCHEVKTESDFYKSNKRYCKLCIYQKAVSWKKEHPDRSSEARKRANQKWRSKNKEEISMYYKDWYKKTNRFRAQRQTT